MTIEGIIRGGGMGIWGGIDGSDFNIDILDLFQFYTMGM